MEGTSCDRSYHCRDGSPCQSCRSVLECPAAKMCHLSKKDQYVCQSHHRIAEAVTGVLGDAQFSSGPLYHPRSSCGRFGHPREATVCAGNFPDSNGIRGDFKRQNRSHQTEPVPWSAIAWISFRSCCSLRLAWASLCEWSKIFTSCRIILRKLCTKPSSSLSSSVMACLSSTDKLLGFFRRLQRNCHNFLANAMQTSSCFASPLALIFLR